MQKRLAVLTIVIAAIVVAASFEIYQTYFTPPPSCFAITSGTTVLSRTTITTFGPVTEYNIPGPDRYSGALTVFC